MIRNEQQYNSTKEWLQKFEQSVAEIENNESLREELLRWKMHSAMILLQWLPKKHNLLYCLISSSYLTKG
jgi:hypothetical protein